MKSRLEALEDSFKNFKNSGFSVIKKEVNKDDRIYALLTSIDEEFCKIEKNFEVFSLPEAYHKIAALIHFLICGILLAERNGWSKKGIRSVLQNAWRIHGYSSFIKYIQTWPRGFVGDFRAVDMIIDRKEKTSPSSLGGMIGKFALNTLIAQQHREKVRIQAEMIKEICKKALTPKIMSLGCGSSRDLEQARYEIKESRARVLLVDFDPEALKESKQRLSEIIGQIDTILVDIRRLKSFFKKISEEGWKFHLIYAVGLFDYLPDIIIRKMLSNLFESFLFSGGVLMFTNVVQGNPYRAWMETMANWTLIERSKEDIERLLFCIDSPKYRLKKDPTGLTWIVYLFNEEKII